jgi:hypothetical protein
VVRTYYDHPSGPYTINQKIPADWSMPTYFQPTAIDALNSYAATYAGEVLGIPVPGSATGSLTAHTPPVTGNIPQNYVGFLYSATFDYTAYDFSGGSASFSLIPITANPQLISEADQEALSQFWRVDFANWIAASGLSTEFANYSNLKFTIFYQDYNGLHTVDHFSA